MLRFQPYAALRLSIVCVLCAGLMDAPPDIHVGLHFQVSIGDRLDVATTKFEMVPVQ